MAPYPAEQRRKTPTLVRLNLIRLHFITRRTDARVQPRYYPRVIRAEHGPVDHTLVDESIVEPTLTMTTTISIINHTSGRRLEMRICRRQGYRRLPRHRHPLVRMAVVLSRRRLTDDLQQIAPFGVERIRNDFQTGLDMAEARGEGLIESTAVFAEPVDAGAGEDETGPAAGIFDVLISAPDGAGWS